MRQGINSARMLLISKDPSTLRTLSKVGEANSWHLQTVCTGLEAIERARSTPSPDVVLLDLVPDNGGTLTTLQWLRGAYPRLPVILLSEEKDRDRMLEALRLGANDFVIKPCEKEQLDRVLRNHFASASPDDAPFAGEEVERISGGLPFIAVSSAMKKLHAQAELLAPAGVHVLIVGEQGTGKETTARLIHELSPRCESRFLKVDCAGLSGDHLERELFGHEVNSPNSFGRHKLGKLELGRAGTLLLREITEMSSHLQAKVVSALQGVPSATGSDNAALNIRILGTIRTDPDQGPFYDKLNTDFLQHLGAFTIHVPPLRQRREDILILLRCFMKQMARRYGIPPRTLSANAVAACERYAWPGNMAELENFAKAYLMLGDNASLMLGGKALFKVDRPDRANLMQQLPQGQANGGAAAATTHAPETASLKSLVRNVTEETERTAIAAALTETHWNRKAAARLLKISYRALLYKIEHHQMRPPQL